MSPKASPSRGRPGASSAPREPPWSALASSQQDMLGVGKIVHNGHAFVEDAFAHQSRCCVPKHVSEPTNVREAGLVEVTLLLLSVQLRFHVIKGNYE